MFSVLWQILENSAADPEAGEIICVLDALDECSKAAREVLIQRLSRFYMSRNKSHTKLKFLATSRAYFDIERAFQREIKDMRTISLRGEDESVNISKEIDLVINEQLPKICGARSPPLGPEVQNALISCLKKFENRTYLWLHLVFDAIQDSLYSTKFHLERLVNRLPGTVEDAYEKILWRVNGSDHSQEARSLLHIVVAALRPLTLGEMKIALAINEKLAHGEPCQSYDDLELESEEAFQIKIRNFCGLFLSVVDSKVYLIHQTAKEFLISADLNDKCASLAKPALQIWKHSMAPLESNLIVLKICFSYLLLREIDSERTFLEYAVRYWAAHFYCTRQKIDELVWQSTMDVCEPRPRLFIPWWPTYLRFCGPDIYSFTIEAVEDSTSLMIASVIGLDMIVKYLLEKESVKLNSQDERGHTALHLAVGYQRLEVTKLLIDQDDIDLNIQDHNGRTALYLAVDSQQLEFIRLLIDHDDIEVNLKDNNGRSLLSSAARWQNLEALELLLKKADINLQDGSGRTVLSNVAEKGLLTLVRVLIKKDDIRLNLKDEHGQIALHLATIRGYSDVVKVLIGQNGIDIDLRDNFGRTPLLSWFLTRRNLGVLKLLLNKGANIDITDDAGQTPLSSAIEKGRMKAVELLIQRDDININHEHPFNGQTLLSMAAKMGNLELVELLLSKHADVNLSDSCGRTPVSWAARRGNLKVVELLLNKHADVDFRDRDGRTSLSRAAKQSNLEVLKLLLDTDTDVNLQDSSGRTPLSWVAERRNSEVIELFLNKDVDINLEDSQGQTPLWHAVMAGISEVVRLLLEKKARLSWKKMEGHNTALSWAAWKGWSEMVKVLLEKENIEFDFQQGPRQGRFSLFMWVRSKRYT